MRNLNSSVAYAGSDLDMVGADDQSGLPVLETNLGTVYGETDAGNPVTLWDAERHNYKANGPASKAGHPAAMSRVTPPSFTNSANSTDRRTALGKPAATT